MKKLIMLLLPFFLSGCFNDEGSYNYEKMDGPTWLFDPSGELLYAYCNVGSVARLSPPFRFDKDSVNRLANVRYEWILNGVVVSEERDLEISTDTLIKLIHMDKFPESGGINGSFSVIDKNTDIRYMVRVCFVINPRYTYGDWVVLSEKEGNSKLSFVKQLKRTGNGIAKIYYEVQDDLYKTLNREDIPGRPLKMRYYLNKGVSAKVGSMTVITDQGSCVINNENFLKTGELKDEFFDGTPTDFKISNTYYCDYLSLIATSDGRLFRRVLPLSWLGGKFLSDPYTVDGEGYKITDFGVGQTSLAGPSMMGDPGVVPCYDELNRRVLMIGTRSPYTIKPLTGEPGNHPLTPWKMDDGTEVLNLYASIHKGTIYEYPYPKMFTMIYNQGGETYMADFVVNLTTRSCLSSGLASNDKFPGGNLDKESLFLSTSLESARTATLLFYTKGNELRYVDMSGKEDHPFLTFGAKITALGLNSQDYQYNRIAVGLENGDFAIYDITSLSAPKIIEGSAVNFGGKVISVIELRDDWSAEAY